MLFLCARCRTRYKVADEKVRGRVLKIRCRHCNALIVLKGSVAEGADSAPNTLKTARPIETHSPAPPSSNDHHNWFAAVGRERQGPMSADAIVNLVKAGTLNGRSYVWRSGMSQWQHLENVNQFKNTVESAVIPALDAQQKPGLVGPLDESTGPEFSTGSETPDAQETVESDVLTPISEPLEESPASLITEPEVDLRIDATIATEPEHQLEPPADSASESLVSDDSEVQPKHELLTEVDHHRLEAPTGEVAVEVETEPNSDLAVVTPISNTSDEAFASFMEQLSTDSSPESAPRTEPEFKLQADAEELHQADENHEHSAVNRIQPGAEMDVPPTAETEGPTATIDDTESKPVSLEPDKAVAPPRPPPPPPPKSKAKADKKSLAGASTAPADESVQEQQPIRAETLLNQAIVEIEPAPDYDLQDAEFFATDSGFFSVASPVSDDELDALPDVPDAEDEFYRDISNKQGKAIPQLDMAMVPSSAPSNHEVKGLVQEFSLMIRLEKRTARKKLLVGGIVVLAIAGIAALTHYSNQVKQDKKRQQALNRDAASNISQPIQYDEKAPTYEVVEASPKKAPSAQPKPTVSKTLGAAIDDSVETQNAGIKRTARKKAGHKTQKKKSGKYTKKKSSKDKNDMTTAKFEELTRDSTGKSEFKLDLAAPTAAPKKQLDNKVVTNLIRRRMRSFQRCVRSGQRTQARLSFSVNRSGAVNNVKVSLSGGADTAVSNCVKGIASKWQFPPIPEPQRFTRTLVL